MIQKSNKLPKISIITPSFNQANFLEKNIFSVINQRYPNVEHIIVDGGSTDGTLDILKKYNNKLGYWVSEKDRGQSHALNRGIGFASGDWIGWQNSDDYYCEGTFWRLAYLVNKYPTIKVFFGNKYCVNASEKVLRKQFYINPDLNIYKSIGMTMCNQSAFIHKDVFKEVGLLDESLNYAMDHEFFLRLFLNNIPMLHDKKLLGVSRYHDESKSCGDNKNEWQNEKKMFYKKYNIKYNSRFEKHLLVKRYYKLLVDNKLDFLAETIKRLYRKLTINY
ncbi:MAG: glycosyltransferase [Clostridiales bacterium]|nr:glycosyltransferase [Clostridiales bacterium]MCF8023155.1 glycosyltransferase [Clostridiales bacterium]